MRLNGEVGEDVLGIEGEIHKRASISSTRLRQKMRMEVDILNYVTEGVLSMEYEDGQ